MRSRACLLCALALPAAAAAQSFTNFGVTGAVGTFPLAINKLGDVAGY